ncbi:MAG: DUF2948 family protein [Amphiplicatus sp.]
MVDPDRYKPLRLIAADADDLGVLSACLQDAVAKVGDFAWLPAERRFAFVANRFVWELDGGAKGPFWRTRAGAHFNDVKSVQHINIRNNAKDAVVELLAIRYERREDSLDAIYLDFSGGGVIRLDVEAVNAEMRDLSGPWRAHSKPAHD